MNYLLAHEYQAIFGGGGGGGGGVLKISKIFKWGLVPSVSGSFNPLLHRLFLS